MIKLVMLCHCFDTSFQKLFFAQAFLSTSLVRSFDAFSEFSLLCPLFVVARSRDDPGKDSCSGVGMTIFAFDSMKSFVKGLTFPIPIPAPPMHLSYAAASN